MAHPGLLGSDIQMVFDGNARALPANHCSDRKNPNGALSQAAGQPKKGQQHAFNQTGG